METIKGYTWMNPDLQYLPSGLAICKFDLFKIPNDRNAMFPMREDDYYHIVAWEKLAELIPNVIDDDCQLYIKGYFKVNSWASYGEEFTSKSFTAKQIWLVKDGQPVDINTYQELIDKEG